MRAKEFRRMHGVVVAAVLATVFSLVIPSQAANKYWDFSAANNLTPGNGTWDTTSSFWATGNAPGTAAPGLWVNGDDAFFQAVGISTVTVNTVSVRNITFETSGAITRIAAGTGPMTLTGNITANWGNGGSTTTNIISSDIILGNNSAITFQRNYGDGANGNYLALDGAISGAGRKLIIAQTSATGAGGNGTLWLNNGANSFSGGFDAGGRYVYTTATSGTPFGTGTIDTRTGSGDTPVVPIYLTPSGSGADVSLSAANAAVGTRININGGGLFVLNRGSNNSLTFTVGNAGAAANSVINRVGARDALTVQYTNTLGTDEKFIVNGGVTVNNGMVTPYITGLKGTADDFLTYDGTDGFKTVTYDMTGTFVGANNTSKVLLTGNLAPGANAAAYALNVRSGTLDMGGNTLTMGNGTDPAGLIIRGTINNGKVTSAGDMVVTSNGGTINASVEGTGTLAASGAGTLKLGGDVKIANISAGAGTIEMSGNSAQVLNSVVSITGGQLTKTGTGTTTFSSAGNSINAINISNGTLKFDNSVSANPSLSLISTGDALNARGGTFQMDAGTLNLPGRIRLANDGSTGVVRIMGGTVNHTGNEIDLGYNGGIASMTIGGTATYNGAGRLTSISIAYNANSFLNVQDSATATVGEIGVARNNGVPGTTQYGTLGVSGTATLTATRMSVAQVNGNATASTYGQVNLDGGTTTINGYVSMAENQASGILQGVINLNGGTLRVQDRIYGGTGKSFVNLHGGTLAYSGAAAKANFFNLGANGKAFIYEDSTIDTGTQNVTIDQALLTPNSGQGLTSVALTSGGSGYTVAPSVKITGGGGEGATAIAVLNASGVLAEIRITNPGTGYTSAPTISLDRGARVGGADATLGAITLANNAFAGGFTKTGSGILILNGDNTYEGQTTINAGTIRMGHANALGGFGNGLAVNGAGSTLDMQGHAKTVSRLEGTGASIITGTGGEGVNFLTVDQAGNSSFAGSLQSNVALIKSGSGTLTLSGTHSTAGGFDVSEGTLILNGTKSGSGAVNVTDGATLGGSGYINGQVTMATGAIHSPGTSPGIQTFNEGLTYETGASLKWELAGNTLGTRGTDFDGVDVTGGDLAIDTGVTLNLTFNEAGSTVNWNNAFWSESREWRMIAFSGAGMSVGNFDSVNVSLDSQGQSLGATRAGASFTSVRSDNDLLVSYIIPEPATAGMLLIGMAGLVLRRRALRA